MKTFWTYAVVTGGDWPHEIQVDSLEEALAGAFTEAIRQIGSRGLDVTVYVDERCAACSGNGFKLSLLHVTKCPECKGTPVVRKFDFTCAPSADVVICAQERNQ